MNEGTPQQSMTVSAQRATTFSGRGEGGAPPSVGGGAGGGVEKRVGWQRVEKRVGAMKRDLGVPIIRI